MLKVTTTGSHSLVKFATALLNVFCTGGLQGDFQLISHLRV